MRTRRGLVRAAVAVATFLGLAFQGSGAFAQRSAEARAYQSLPVVPGTWKQLDPALLDTNGTDPEPLATGRVLSLAYGGGVLFAGAAGGGVWTSSDGGQTWTPRTDTQLGSLVIGALAVSPSDPKVVLAGTGDEGQLDQTGDGIYRSTDGGVTWTRVTGNGLAQMAISKIVIDPSNPQRIYAGVMNANPDSNNLGVVASTDGGQTWKQTRLADARGIFPNVTDLAIDARGGVYAAVGGFGHSDLVGAGAGSANGVWYSSDGGQSWTQVSNGLPSLSAACSGDFMQCGGFYKIALLPSTTGRPQSQQTLYAGVGSGADSDTLLGIFRTTNGGGSWTDITGNLESTNPCDFLDGGTSQASGNLVLQPGDGNTLYVGRIDVFKTDQAASSRPSWQNISHVYGQDGRASCPTVKSGAIHADQHAMLAVPGAGTGGVSRMYFAGDGGIFYSDNGGQSYGSANGQGSGALSVLQFYNGSISPDGTRALGGSQDNGTLLGTFDAAHGTYSWKEVVGGDGGYSIIDPVNPNTMYAENPNADFVKSTSGGASPDGWSSTCPVPVTPGDCSRQAENAAFTAPAAMDPSNDKTLYLGMTHVWRTTDSAGHWSNIGPVNTGGPISSLAVSAANSNVVYAGNQDGTLWATANALASDPNKVAWTSIGTSDNCRTAAPSCTQEPITGIDVDPADASGKTVYVTVDGYSAGKHVFRSADGGKTWTDISTGLPALPFHTVVVGPKGTIYAGANRGVYQSSDGGKSWSVLGTGLPNAWVMDVVVHGSAVYAFTYGRGLWAFGASSTPPAKPALAVSSAYVAHIKGNYDYKTKSIKLGEKADFVVTYKLTNGQGIKPTATLSLLYKGKPAGTYSMFSIKFSDGTVGFAKEKSITDKSRLGSWTARFTVTAGTASASRNVSFSLKK